MKHLLRNRRLAITIAVFLCASVGAFAWLGYRILREWQDSATDLAQRRADEAADLLVMALTRDMRAVQKSALSPSDWSAFMVDPPYDVSNTVAGVFARYPYPESFVASRGTLAPETFLFFDRADRRAAWASAAPQDVRTPVVVHRSTVVAAAIAAQIRSDAAAHQKFVAFELPIDGQPYQVVLRLFYEDQFRDHLVGLFGFTVNLNWAHEHYFWQVARQVVRISDFGAGLALELGNRGDRFRSSVEPEAAPISRRALPIMFFDPLSTLGPRSDREPDQLHLRVSAERDPALLSAHASANQGVVVAGVAAATLAIGLVLTVGAIKANADLSVMRSEFVSTVTHELKTPIATIRAAGASLSAGRLEKIVDPAEYGRLVVQEAKRLTRLVDNLLALSRITDVAQAYFFEPVRVEEVVDAALHDYRWFLDTKQFEVHVDVAESLPPVRADRLAIGLLLDNLIDNAIRYSPNQRFLEIAGSLHAGDVRIDVRDRGQGIPENELRHVTRKFFRGHRAAAGGSGLGLAIVKQIVTSHGGTLDIASGIGTGTTVSVSIPIAQDA